jgi:hypothetical protein
MYINKNLLKELFEHHLKKNDVFTLHAMAEKARIVNATGNAGYMAKRNHRFVGDIDPENYYRVIRKLPREDRKDAKRYYHELFSKFAVQSKSKYI